MKKLDHKELLDAGVHFGHLKSKWNPKMLQYIFMEKKGIHLIDLNKTIVKAEEAANALKQVAKSGRKILFVATKKQAKEQMKALAESVNMPHVTERWLGGMLTNFGTIKKSIKKMQTIDTLLADESNTSLTKKERLMMSRQRAKLETVLGGMKDLNRLPAAVFMVDVLHEHIAVAESRKLNIRTFGMVDTNSNPNLIDFPIPANDDASKSINIITEYIIGSVKEGLEERESKEGAKKEEPSEKKA
ncbi:MAG: small subunit ribosomal protein S2 [Planctomycetota bacterium]|jgi:small subunit ribosomal protein S2